MDDKTLDPRLARPRRIAVSFAAVLIVIGTAAALIWSVAPQREVRSAPVRKRNPIISLVVGGTVRTSDGKPAPGVRVSLSTYHLPTVFQLDGGITGKTVLTKADGKFSFETSDAPQGFIASGDAGYAMGNLVILNRPLDLVLTPWGRVEGTVKRGPIPVANSSITLSYGLAIPSRWQSFFQSALDITTDANGRFRLDRVPEGILRLGLAARDGHQGARQKMINVASGATTTIDFGGKGRPVVGRLDPPVASDVRQVTLVPDVPYPFAGRDFSKLSGLDLIAAQHELANSPQYNAWIDARRNSVVGDVDADGTFRFEEVVSGKYRLLAEYSSLTKASNNAPAVNEQIATTRSSVTVDPIPDGASDQPLDLGSIPLKVVKRLAIAQSVPDFVATDSSGKPVKLSEFKGRYVLLLFSPTDTRGVERNSAVRFGGVFDRFASDPRLAMLVVHTGRGAEAVASESVKAGVRWRPAYIENADSVPEEYAGSSRMLLLIDPSRNLLARTLDPLTAYGAVERALAPNGQFRPAQIPGGTVESERVITSVAYGGKDYVKVPPPSSSDAAQVAEFTSVAGRIPTPNQSLDCLHDGLIQASPDDLNNSFFYDPASVEGRLKIDLGKSITIARVNTYSWHKDDRAPQVYVLYASTGSAPNFDASPAAGIDPSTCGWAALAQVDTRALGRGGRHAVSITHNNADLGTYRYLLLEIFPTETRDKFGGTFYGEIDVIEK